MSYSLFAYGTLMVDEIISLVVGRALSGTPATLPGYHRSLLHGEVYPAIRPEPLQFVDGILYSGLRPREMRNLDLFEGEMYQRQPVEVELADARKSLAETYVLHPDYYSRLSGSPWSLQDFLNRGKDLFVAQYAGVAKILEGGDS